jgi:hypothetical protein
LQSGGRLYAADGGRMYLNQAKRRRVLAVTQTLDRDKALFALTLVDAVMQRPDDVYWLYEIKTSVSVRACIREARWGSYSNIRTGCCQTNVNLSPA